MKSREAVEIGFIFSFLLLLFYSCFTFYVYVKPLVL